MAELVLKVFIDGLMALLLIITTYYCWRLNKRIRVLQDAKSELGRIIAQFDESTQRATDSIAEIHQATARLSENMQHKIDKANYLADDLQFMIEKGNKIADRMEGGISSGRSSSTRSSSPAPSRPSRQDDVGELEPRSTGRTAPRESRSSVEDAVAKAKSAAQPRASLESVLKRVAASGENAKANEADANDEQGDARRARRAQGGRLRSKAEQELFEALKSGGTKG